MDGEGSAWSPKALTVAIGRGRSTLDGSTEPKSPILSTALLR